MFDLALVIPCYNESKRVKPAFQAYFQHFKDSSYWQQKKVALVFVDDGSVDDTYAILKEFEKLSMENLSVIALRYESNRGKGGAIKHGVSSVEAAAYGFTDADLAYEPKLVDGIFRELENNDLVIGRRINDNQVSVYSKFRNFISSGLRKLVHLFLSLPDYDTQCGFKFFNKKVSDEVVPQVKHDRFSFDIELILRALKGNLKVKELPINFTHSNESTVTWRDGVRYVLDAISISEELQSVSFKRLASTLLGISVFASFILYGWVIKQGFLFSDDFTWLWHGQKVSSLYDVMTFRMSTFYSPVMNGFYATVQNVFGYNPQPIFAINILAHALVSWLAGILTWQMTKSRLVAVITVSLAAVAGVAYEPLVWIGANMHSFVTFFVLGSLVTYNQYFTSNKGLYLLGSLLFFILALGTKESAIVTPALLLFLTIYKHSDIRLQFNFSIAAFWSVVSIGSIGYLYRQYLWQKNSIWVESGVWNLSFNELVRLPLILLDNLIPIGLLKFYLTNNTAILLSLVAFILFAFILYKFRQVKLVWFGLAWTLVGVAPFIFFNTQFWWEPLASRYNYLPRIGVIIILASIFHYLVVHNKARHIVSGLLSIVVISVVSQLVFMAYVVNSQYNYVYNTGRSLTQIMEEIKTVNPDKILVRWDYPFTGNNAHIVGAASIIANIEEERLKFLQKGDIEHLEQKEILLYWNAQARQYDIKYN